MDKHPVLERNNSVEKRGPAAPSAPTASPSSPSSWNMTNGDNNVNNNNNNGVVSDEDNTGDDYCVYTYKGDSKKTERLADLPSSFFEFYSSSEDPYKTSGGLRHDLDLNGCSGEGDLMCKVPFDPTAVRPLTSSRALGRGSSNNELYSPEMDFLEMDFDPGGPGESCDTADEFLNDSDTEFEHHSHEEGTPSSSVNVASCSKNMQNPPPCVFPCLTTSVERQDNNSVDSNNSVSSREEKPCCSKNFVNNSEVLDKSCENSSSLVSIRLVKSNTLPEIDARKKSFADPPVSSRSAMVVSNSAPLINHETDESSSKKSIELEVNGVMIWSKEEAMEKSYQQIGTSACGATAVLNVLSALGSVDFSPAEVKCCVKTRLRAQTADLPEYLFSRSNAGATHEDLLAGIDQASNGAVYGRFFQPSSNISTSTFMKWLLHWMCQGAVPVVTRNLQIEPVVASEEIPDSWHHQMVFGITQEGVFLNNPVEKVPLGVLLPQIKSSSVLLIRRQDVISRKGPRSDLRKLVRHADPRWNQMNVLGQVSNMLLEEMPIFNGSTIAKRIRSTHVSIPAAYTAGISLFAHVNSPLCQLMKNAPNL